jgi:NitT/TauT family transport system substrate-binding protein
LIAMRRSSFLAATVALAAPARIAVAQEAVPVRMGVIASGGQTEIPLAVQKYALDRKYGIALQEVDLSAPGQQYVMFRADTIDLAPGTFVDLMRQRKAGIALQAFHSAQRYNNYIVTKPQSPIRSFADIKGKRMGEFGTTFLDWLILRAAGKKAFGFDVETESELVQGSPPLLNQFLAKGEVDAMLQFSTLTLGAIKSGDQRLIIDVPSLMRRAGFSPDCFNSHWLVTEKWNAAHPGAVRRLSQMVDEAYVKLRTDDALWPVLGDRIGFTDPGVVVAYRDLARREDNPPYNRGLIAPTQTLLDAINAIAGTTATGVTSVDPTAFLFPYERR